MLEKRAELVALDDKAGRHFFGVSPIIIIFVTVAAVLLPMAFLGIPDGFDLMQHMRFAASYHDALMAGELIPKWSALDNFGFGGIGVRYYPPVVYYLLALTRTVTGSWYHSFWVTTLFWGWLGSLGVYAWIKESADIRSATFAAVVYAVIPYHTFQIYQAVLYAEFAAAGVLPFCFLFMTRICRRRLWSDAALFSIAYAILLLIHLPTAIIATICIGVFGLAMLDWKHVVDTATKLASAGVLSVLAASFHLVKVVTEMDWVKHNSPEYFSEGYYNFSNFFFPMYFFSTQARYVEKMLSRFDTLIALTLLCFVCSIVALWLHGARSETDARDWKFERSIAMTGIFAFFMLSIASSFLWNNIPLLAKIQFPWRWLSVASLMVTVAIGVAAGSVLFRNGRLNRYAAYPAMVLALVLLLYTITQSVLPSAQLDQSTFETKVAAIYDEPGCECWWPVWAKASAFDDRERARSEDHTAIVEKWEPTYREFSVTGSNPGQLRVATFYHPYWMATANGMPVAVGAGDDGALSIPVPQGSAVISLHFAEPTAVLAAKWISAVTWIFLGLFVLQIAFQSRNRFRLASV